jgi:hypothetical protein
MPIAVVGLSMIRWRPPSSTAAKLRSPISREESAMMAYVRGNILHLIDDMELGGLGREDVFDRLEQA